MFDQFNCLFYSLFSSSFSFSDFLDNFLKAKYPAPASPPTTAETAIVPGLNNAPVAPIDCKVAKALPAYIAPRLDCMPAAIEALAIPLVVNPTAEIPNPAPVTALAPTAPPMPTFFKIRISNSD